MKHKVLKESLDRDVALVIFMEKNVTLEEDNLKMWNKLI